MDFRNQQPSRNLIDRTGRNDRQRQVHTILTLLDPVIAANNAYDWLQSRGVIAIRPQVEFRKK